MAKETPHLTYRLTDERKEKIDRLRQLLGASRTDGDRVHGMLTTAQILDWGIDALLDRFKYREEIERIRLSDD